MDKPHQASYLRFTVTGVTGTIQNATLRLFNTNRSPNGPAIYGTDNSWAETGITWNNRPAATTGPVDNIGWAGKDVWVGYNVTALITGNGSYSFVLVADSSDGVRFDSREGDQPPQLMLTFTSGPTIPPDPTIPTHTPIPPTATPTNTPTGNALYVSSSSGGWVQGISFDEEDILFFDGTNWTKFLDMSDVISHVDVDAFALLDDGSVLLSFDNREWVPGIGSVDDSDIVRFVPTSTGNQTAGTFSLYFDGSDVGLSESDEDVDALGITPDGRLLLSTTGNFRVPGLSGMDKDLFAFTPTSLGSHTAGSFSLYFDGSDVGLTSGSEDINGAWLDGTTGQLYLTTIDRFTVPGLSGERNDVFTFTPTSLGSSTSGSFGPGLYFDGDANGFGSERIDALAIGPVPNP